MWKELIHQKKKIIKMRNEYAEKLEYCKELENMYSKKEYGWKGFKKKAKKYEILISLINNALTEIEFEEENRQ